MDSTFTTRNPYRQADWKVIYQTACETIIPPDWHLRLERRERLRVEAGIVEPHTLAGYPASTLLKYRGIGRRYFHKILIQIRRQYH